MKFVFLSIIFTLSFASASLASQRPLKVAVFGNSITAATMADEYPNKPSKRFYQNLIQVGVSIGIGKLTKNEVSFRIRERLEESNKAYQPITRKKYSFLLGDRDYSLKANVRRSLGIDVDIVDLTLIGGGYEFSDVAVNKLVRNVKETKIAPDVILVNFTAMDFLYGHTAEAFESYLITFYQSIISLYPNSNIVVGQLIDPIDFMIREDRVVADRHPNPFMADKKYRCSDSFELNEFGKDLKLYAGYLGPRVDENRIRLQEYREALARTLDSIKTREGIFKNFTGELVFAKKDGIEIEMADKLSIDCIHPNIDGHKLLGEMFWNSAKHIFTEDSLKLYEFSDLAPKCENKEGYGRQFWCSYGLCAKKSEAVVNSNDSKNFCRVTAY